MITLILPLFLESTHARNYFCHCLVGTRRTRRFCIPSTRNIMWITKTTKEVLRPLSEQTSHVCALPNPPFSLGFLLSFFLFFFSLVLGQKDSVQRSSRVLLYFFFLV